MKTEILEILSEVIGNVSVGHQIYTKEEVISMLQKIQTKIENDFEDQVPSSLEDDLTMILNEFDFEEYVEIDLNNKTIEIDIDDKGIVRDILSQLDI